MGKIVKYCNSCDEGFAPKFTFCPDCGKTLEAFEMNPLGQEKPAVEEIAAAPIAVDEAEFLEAPHEEIPVAAVMREAQTVAEPAPERVVIERVEELPPPRISAAPPAAPATPFIQTKPVDADRMPVSLSDEHDAFMQEGQFYVTVIEEKNVKQRNRLLLGSTVLMLSTAAFLTLWSLFNVPLSVYAIGSDSTLASLIDDVPMVVEDEPKQQKKDKDAGGGGGGGREEKEEVTQGDLADQSKNPTRPPDAKVPRADFELKTPPPQTEGNKTFEKKFDRWGDPNGRFASLSNGTGSGGGQGSGTGTGQGSGRGTGAGSGTGSGYGGGLGNGNGNGTGDGDGGLPPPPSKPKVTEPIKIISKPQARYTDATRQNNFTGQVQLRITFLASGQIGSVTAVSSLPYGLTEQAIAAAKQIRFEPAKRDGVPYTVTKTFQYGFNIY